MDSHFHLDLRSVNTYYLNSTIFPKSLFQWVGDSNKMLKQEKIKWVEKLSDEFKKNNGIVFFNYKGLNANEFNELRNKFKRINSYIKVVKNNLASRVLEMNDLLELKNFIQQETALIIGNEPVTLVKLIFELAKQNEKIKIRGGYVNREICDYKKMEWISKLPSKEILTAQLLYALRYPLIRLKFNLQFHIYKLVFLLNELKKLKGG